MAQKSVVFDVLKCFNIKNMEAIHRSIKITVPNYFRSLPILKSIDNFAKLTTSDWTLLVLFIHLLLLIIVAVVKLSYLSLLLL